MADITEASADPSMEEILASIRKIISDENPPVEAAPAEGAVIEEVPVAVVAPFIPPEDVVELTQMIQDDGSVIDLSAPEPVVVTPSPPPAPIGPAESLVSEPVANTMASKLSSLANTVEIERLSSAPLGKTFIGNGHRTLEDMVIELMRPLLKDWLDHNLPSVVERLVQKEIERIARRS